MSEFIQVGSTAMRDPVTGEFLPSVPLYIRAEDQGKVATPVFDGELMRTLAEKFRAYRKEERQQKKAKAAGKNTETIGKRIDTMLDEYGKGQKRAR